MKLRYTPTSRKNRLGTVLAIVVAGVVSSTGIGHLIFDAAHAAETTVSTSQPAPDPLAAIAAERTQQLSEADALLEAAQQESQLQQRRENSKNAAAEIKTEIKRLADLTTFAWPTEGGVSSGWGMRMHPILGYSRLHNGADIGGACGNPIYAAQSGKVTHAASSSSSGNNIRINHGKIEGKQVETAYLHMTKYVVKSGDQVKKGDLVGYVGNTGLSTACHLHLALYVDGEGSDPLEYLSKD